MTDHEFDPDDLEALRRLKTDRSREALDGRTLRSPDAASGARSHQLNVRVRREIKEMVHRIARRHRCTITEVIEGAVEEFYPEAMKAALLRRQPQEEDKT